MTIKHKQVWAKGHFQRKHTFPSCMLTHITPTYVEATDSSLVVCHPSYTSTHTRNTLNVTIIEKIVNNVIIAEKEFQSNACIKGEWD
jgi:hypothetical protein